MTTKRITEMSKSDLREACAHQRTALQNLLASHKSVRHVLEAAEFPGLALIEAAGDTAQRALDAYE